MQAFVTPMRQKEQILQIPLKNKRDIKKINFYCSLFSWMKGKQLFRLKKSYLLAHKESLRLAPFAIHCSPHSARLQYP